VICVALITTVRHPLFNKFAKQYVTRIAETSVGTICEICNDIQTKQHISIAFRALICISLHAEGQRSSICGGHLQGSASGYVRSPGFPQRYPNNVRCQWVITTDIGSGMQLFFEHLDNKEMTSSGATGAW